jgi:DNA adenine methylase
MLRVILTIDMVFLGEDLKHTGAGIAYRSPFRYPGGKTWLVPYVRRWLRSLVRKPRLFVEPFAGGGSIALTVAFEEMAHRVLMVELDENVAAVWNTILDSDGDWLARRIGTFVLTKDSVVKELQKTKRSGRELAFQTLLRNRVSHGGILAPGAGLINMGENKKGIGSRWYPTALRQRIRDIMQIKNRIEFIHDDGLAILRRYQRWSSAVFFIDPPYIGASGNRLYKYSNIDHRMLFQIASRISGNCLITYDNVPQARDLAEQHGFDTCTVAMRNGHHRSMEELLIAKDLSWAKEMAEDDALRANET